jgi:hypothetical protein
MTLDHFEQSLLTDLREHVVLRTDQTPHAVPRRTRRWRWAAVPAGLVTVVVAGLMLLQPSGAYAVTSSGDEVVVTIKRLDDAAGLQRALADHGIKADVDYSAKALPPAGDGDSTRSAGPTPGPTPGPGTRLPRISSSLEGDQLTLRIEPDTIPTEAVLHITTVGSAESGLSGLRVMFSQAP